VVRFSCVLVFRTTHQEASVGGSPIVVADLRVASARHYFHFSFCYTYLRYLLIRFSITSYTINRSFINSLQSIISPNSFVFMQYIVPHHKVEVPVNNSSYCMRSYTLYNSGLAILKPMWSWNSPVPIHLHFSRYFHSGLSNGISFHS